MTVHIDINCDMGESYGAWKMGEDAAAARRWCERLGIDRSELLREALANAEHLDLPNVVANACELPDGHGRGARPRELAGIAGPVIGYATVDGERVAVRVAGRDPFAESYHYGSLQPDFEELTAQAEELVAEVTGLRSLAGPARRASRGATRRRPPRRRSPPRAARTTRGRVRGSTRS